MLRFGFLLPLALGVAAPAASAMGDTLVMESMQSASAVPRPASGVTMDRVIENFGEPQQRLGPVGDPPISHWVYPEFVVYFEYDRVIHAVVPRR
ncbi:MAG: hypothetical protein PVI91_13685 [Gammaproteobacteria bacterium]|jgi:hypothetical protein